MKTESVVHLSCMMSKQHLLQYLLAITICVGVGGDGVSFRQLLRVLGGRIRAHHLLQPAAPPLHFPSLSVKQTEATDLQVIDYRIITPSAM